mmetsp:Transcript_17502/g.29378  ORF Transcript_17502/g.29378 Transcript_17502/m.29378 type:complete len:647 (-) Transcript_17502:293-2233(-)|eukprot:CAMPEP_0198197004 /NCGR_PEP_ID=MMETSP1445-20131203/600_1 /TAXON_ID=36898 /ORGANISM="Pyramimonas sp., Strain CCMP2087" /LENGTH=646 /DNA_ID=CAMNT_0043866133 /DNA_START=225 /DNA_END=2165 /DNA_ORIENTATION=-
MGESPVDGLISTLKPALKAVSTVANKYLNAPANSSAPSTTSGVRTNNKKKKKGATKVTIIPEKETTIHWADQSPAGQLTKVELYFGNQWLAESKPSIAHLSHLQTAQTPTNGSGPSVAYDNIEDIDEEEAASPQLTAAPGEAEEESVEMASKKQEGNLEKADHQARPVSVNAAKKQRQKEKAEGLKKAQELKDAKPTANGVASARASTSVDSENSVNLVKEVEPIPLEKVLEKVPEKDTSKPVAVPKKKVSFPKCKGCLKPVDRSLECPLCVKEVEKANDQSLRSYFCGQPCFKASWAAHKKHMHATKGADKTDASKVLDDRLKSSKQSSPAKTAKVNKDLAATVADAHAAAEAANTSLLSEQSKEAAALMGIVTLLMQGKEEMAKGATGLRERTLDKAALHYEAAIRLFRWASAAGLAVKDDEKSRYVVGAQVAEADSWRKLAYVRALTAESMPWAQRAYLSAMRLYMTLGLSRELAMVMVDLARSQLAQADYANAQGMMRRASMVLKQEGVGENALAHALLLHNLGEMKTELHLSSPAGWQKASDGEKEDTTDIREAVDELKTALALFIANHDKLSEALKNTTTSVRFAISRATLLAGNIDEAQSCLVQVMADDSWKLAYPQNAKQAEAMATRLVANVKKSPAA